MKTFVKILVLAILAITVCTILACPNGTSTTTYPNGTTAEKPKMAAAFSPGQVGPFVIPASWKQATWFVDPLSVSTCASDNNRTCASSSCTSGDGPCLTLGSIVSRWGTQSPVIQQATLITYMSQPASSGVNDPIVLSPQPGQPDAQLGFACNLGAAQQTGTGAITVVNAKTRTMGASHLLTVTYPAGAATGNIVINTMHPSIAWVSAASGGNFTTTQPFLATTPSRGIQQPAGFGTFVEVDTWTTGDTVTTYSPIQINMISLTPTPYTTLNSATSPFQSAYVNQCDMRQPTGGSSTGIFLNEFVNVFEASAHSALTWTAPAQAQSTIAANLFANTSTSVANSAVIIKPFNFIGGKIGFPSLNNIDLGGDIEVGGTGTASQLTIGSSLTVTGGTNGFEIDSAVTLNVLNSGTLGGFGGNGVAWGPGTLNFDGSSRFTYPTGGTGSTNFFLQTGLTINGGTTLECVRNTVDSGTPVCGLTLTAASLDTVNGAQPGCVFQPGGASLCNFGP